MSSVDATTLNPPVAFKVGWPGLAVIGAWLAVALLISYWPNATRDWPMTQGLAHLCVGVAAVFGVSSVAGRRFARLGLRLRGAASWLIALPLLLGVWELLTAKLGLLPVPFFAPPRPCSRCMSKTTRAWPTACCIRRCCSVRAWRWARRPGLSPAWPSVGRRVSAIGCIRVLRILGPVPSTALLPYAFPVPQQLERQRLPDRAGHLVSGHGADLVRRGQCR